MRCTWSIFLLLTIVEIFNAAACNDCAGNTYKNDNSLFSLLTGYLYNLYTTNLFADNEVIKFDMTGNETIYARSTNDGECCRTLNITRGNDHNSYDLASDEDCQTKVSDNSAQIKLLSANTDDDGSICVIFWNCRKSRNVVHTFCDKRKVSLQQKLWIHGQYIWRRLPILEVKQTVDYKGGKCFKN